MNKKESIKEIGIKAKYASNLLANVSDIQKNNGLEKLKKNLKKNQNEIIEINKIDIENGSKINLSSSENVP